MSTLEPDHGRDFGDLIRALIEEAWRRARRRRLVYAGIVLLLAVIGAVVTATLRGPSSSNSTPAAVTASRGTPVSAVTVNAQRARHHYHLYPGDTVDVAGGPHFDWSCTLYRVGYRVFECRGEAEWTRAKPHPLLRTVVVQDGLLVQRGHKNVFGVNR